MSYIKSPSGWKGLFIYDICKTALAMSFDQQAVGENTQQWGNYTDEVGWSLPNS